jgi:hypothetical protein
MSRDAQNAAAKRSVADAKQKMPTHWSRRERVVARVVRAFLFGGVGYVEGAFFEIFFGHTFIISGSLGAIGAVLGALI